MNTTTIAKCEAQRRETVLLSGGRRAIVSYEQNLANAAFIVRAVNAHEALVEALAWYEERAVYIQKKLESFKDGSNPSAIEAVLVELSLDGGRHARAALKLAKGE